MRLRAAAAPGPDRRADEVDRRDAGGLQPGLQAQVEVRRVDADEGARRLGQQAVAPARRGCADLAVVAQHLDVAAHRQLVAAATRPRSPAPPSSARRCRPPAAPASAPAGRRSSRPASRSPEASPATIASCMAQAPCGPAARAQPLSARCRASSAARKSSSSATSASPPSTRARAAPAMAACAASSVRPSRYSRRCICLTRAMRSREKPRRRRPSTLKPCTPSGLPDDHHEGRHVLRDMALEARHRVRADAGRTGARRSGRRRSPSRRHAHGRPAWRCWPGCMRSPSCTSCAMCT